MVELKYKSSNEILNGFYDAIELGILKWLHRVKILIEVKMVDKQNKL